MYFLSVYRSCSVFACSMFVHGSKFSNSLNFLKEVRSLSCDVSYTFHRCALGLNVYKSDVCVD